MNVESKADMFDLPNGAIIQFDERRWIKTRTKKTRYENPESIHVVDLNNGDEKQIRGVNGNVVPCDRDVIAFSGPEHSPNEITHVETDKERLKEYISTY